MELTSGKHEKCLANFRSAVSQWNQKSSGAAEYEVEQGGLGRFLFYRKNKGSEERTQIATIHLTGAGGTMQQNANAPKDLKLLKGLAFVMCARLSKLNPTGNYTLKFKGPDAKEIRDYVEKYLERQNLLSNFTLQAEGVQSVRPSTVRRSSFPSSAASVSSDSVQGAEADEDSASNPYLNPTTS